MKKKKLNSKQRAIQRSLIIATAAFTCVALPANDDTGQKAGQPKAYGQQHHGDKGTKFIQEALQGGQMEVKMAQMGQQKAQNPEVKRLAERLVQDHQAANQELQQLAQGKNIQAAAGHEQKHQGHMEKLQSASGADFDKQFVKHAIQHHKKDIKKFEECSKDMTDAQLKAFVDKTLPKLREHLTMAQAAARSVGVSDAELTAMENEDTAAAGAPAGGITESDKGADTDRANENKAVEESKDQGSSPESESATDQSQSTESSIQAEPDEANQGAGAEAEISVDQSESTSDKPESSDQLSTESSSQPQASLETSSSGFDAATRSDSSLTINQNTLAVSESASGAPAGGQEGSGLDAEARIGDSSASIEADADVDTESSIRADADTDSSIRADADLDVDADVDTDDADASIRTDLDTDKDDGKILGIENQEGDGKTLGVKTVPGDGRTLGINTEKGDGKLLGIIPWRDGDKDADAEVEVSADADTDADVNARVDADTDLDIDSEAAVGGPGTSVSGRASSGEKVEFNQLPENVKSTIRAQGGDNNSTIKRVMAYEVEVNGKKMYVHEDGTTHEAKASTEKR